MMLFIFVYVVIIILIVRQVIIKAQNTQQKNNPTNTYGSQGAYAPPKTGPMTTVNTQTDKAYRVPVQKTVSSAPHGLRQEKQQLPNKQQTVPKAPEKKTSTTDYLERKAKMDQMEHAKEKQEEIRRVNQRYGGQSVGGRYLIGDPIPRGTKLFYCPYCGAENIVPASYRSGMDCYFCRTELK